MNAAGISFGDGVHRCPGQPLATLEADALLTRLLARDPVVVAEPTLGWDDLIAPVSGRHCGGRRGQFTGEGEALGDLTQLPDEMPAGLLLLRPQLMTCGP